jgi:death-on-curing protein
VRYLTLAEALVIAEAVTGIDGVVLSKIPGIGLDSALHAPHGEFGGQEFYPDFIDKAAVLAVRIARNHPLPNSTSAFPGHAWFSFARTERFRIGSNR